MVYPYYTTLGVGTLPRRGGSSLTAAISKTRRFLHRLLLVFLACLKPILAIDPAVSTSQYLHASWTQEEGASLPAVQALAQTPDGYLWLGTATGLIRFNGVRFVNWAPKPGEELPSENIRHLNACSQGGLWIDTAKGVARMDGAHIVRYPALDKWLGGFAGPISVDHAGDLWLAGGASAGGGLAHLRADGTLKVYGAADGLPDQKVQSLFESSRGDLWLGTHDGLCRWSPGIKAECTVVRNLTILFIAEADRGVLVADGSGRRIVRIADGKMQTVLAKVGDASLDPLFLRRDRDGNVWVGTAGQGLVRLFGGNSERLTHRDGLSSDVVSALLEDREGNLWVGTPKGIDQLREPKILHVSTQDGLSSDAVMEVESARGGGVWAGTSGGLDLLDGPRVTHYLMNSGLPTTTVMSLFQGGDGLWVGTTGGLARQSGERFAEVRDERGEHLLIFAMTMDHAGDLILADARKGLLCLHDGVVRSLSFGGSENRHVYQVLAASNGVLWVGYYEGGISAREGESVRWYGPGQGLAQGPVEAIYEDHEGTIWVGTGSGVSRFRNGRWTTWTAAQGLPEGGVNGLQEDEEGGFWLVTSAGILRLSLPALDRIPDGSPAGLSFTLYGLTEGLRLPSSGNMANPRITKSNDGRLWLRVEDGIAVLDPRRIRMNRVPPPVVIEQLMVDGKPMDTEALTKTGFRGHEVQFTYTGLSLSVPEAVRFRYKLDGLDKDWTDAGTRRYVTYVNLPPAKYAFRVMACNNEGIWNRAGARLDFAIAPEFYQTRWFLPLCLLTASMMVWGIYQMRVRSLVMRFKLVAQERARMTRELHDSLLQGFSGVVFQLEAVSRLFDSDPENGKRRLERAMEQADQSLLEARRAIMSMHLPELEGNTLPEALQAAGDRAVEGSPMLFHLTAKGNVRQLPYEIQANLYLVGREAISNAVSHSKGKKIGVQLAYSARRVILTIQDDGTGMDLESALKKTDHRGVAGMHGRAKHIGANLTVDSRPGQGTRIELVANLKA